MKKLFTLLVAVIATSFAIAQPADLFISEYIEGSGNNKAVEIYNGTGNAVTLRIGAIHNYFMLKVGNPTGVETWAVNGTVFLFTDGANISNGDVYVLYNGSAIAPEILAQGDQSSTVCNFNGNDPIALVKDVNNNGTYEDGTDIIVDVVGDMTGFLWGEDLTWVRKPGIDGNPTFTLAEWDEYLIDDFSYLGAHQYEYVFTLPFSENFNSGIPAEWTIVDGGATADTWYGETDYSGDDIDGTPFAFVNSDAAGSVDMDEELITPPIDASTASSLFLEFDHYFNSFGAEICNVDVWDGSVWQNVYSVSGVDVGDWGAPDRQKINILAYANANLKVRFHYYDANYEYYWAVDNVIIREGSSETDILSYSFPEQTGPAAIDTSLHTVALEIGFGLPVTALVADFTLSDFATAEVVGVPQTSGVTVNDFTLPVTYTITAEDTNFFQDWVVTVTTAPAQISENDFLSFSFPEETGPATIDTSTHTIDIEVGWETDVTVLIAYFTTSPLSTVDIGGVPQTSGVTVNNFSGGAVTYTVTAEDATTQDWIVTVSLEPAPQGALCADPISLFLPVVDLVGTTDGFGDNYDNTMSCASSYMNGDDIVYEFILASDGYISGDLSSSESWIGMFILDGCPDAGANCIVTSTSSGSFTSFIDEPILAGNYYVVVSSYPAPQFIDFTMNLSFRQINTETDFLAYSFPEATGPAIIDTSTHTVDVEIGFGLPVTALVADFILSDFATAEIAGVPQTSGVTVNDFTLPVTYTITAEDTNFFQDWVVTVTTAPAQISENDFLSFSFPEETGPATIDTSTHTIDIEVGWETDVTVLIAYFTTSPLSTVDIGGVPQTSGVTVNNFSGGAVTYTVTAEDGITTQDWLITVTQQSIPLGADCSNPILAVEGINTADNSEGGQWFYYTATADVIITISSCGFTSEDTYVQVYDTCGGALIASSDDDCASQSVVSFVADLDSTYYIWWKDNYTSAVYDWSLTTISTQGTDCADPISLTLPVIDLVGTTNGFGDDYDDPSVCYDWYLDGDDIVYEFTLLSDGYLSGSIEGTWAGIHILDGCPGTGENCIAFAGGSSGDSFSDTLIFAGTYYVVVSNWPAPQFIDFVMNLSFTPLSIENDILSFSFPEETLPAIINALAHTVYIDVQCGNDVTALTADFILSAGASADITGVPQINGVTVNDFTTPVIYTITAEDTNFVQDWTITVSAPAPLTTNFTYNDVSCYGDCNANIDLIPGGGTPGYLYSWSDGSTNEDIINICTGGIYCVTVTDINSCTAIACVTITEPALLTVDLGLDTIETNQPDTVVLNADIATIGGTLPYTYQWQDASTDSALTVSAYGWYSVTVTDANSCIATDSIYIDLIDVLNDLDDVNSQISIYPNPNKGEFNIIVKTADKTDLIIELMNVHGQLIYRKDVKNIVSFKDAIDVSEFAKGIYYLKVNTGSQLKVEKVVIQ